MKSNFSKKLSEIKIGISILAYGILFSFNVIAQPSGGPYGPVRQTWQLPKVDGKIYYVAPDGDKEATGEKLEKPTTIEAAFERVKTGDAIIMRGGTYRTGNLILNQGITIQPYMDELPVMKGTYVADQWRDLRNGLWTTKWDHLFPSAPADWWMRNRSGKETPLHRFNDDMVFIDGRFLQAAGYEGEVDDNSFYIDYQTGTVYIGTDPKNKLVEITAFNVAIHRINGDCHGKKTDHKGPVIRGITFTQYAYRAIEFDGKNPEGISPESAHGKDVVGTTLEHCTISFCSRVAAYLRGDKLTLKNCKVSDTSTEGIYVLSSSDVLLEKNIFMRNNIEHITGYYPAAVKIFNQCYRVTCRDNLVLDHPYSNGIWYDVGNVDGRFLNNWVEGVGMAHRRITGKQTWPSESGFFFEISKGTICAGNVFVNCDFGIHILNSCDAQVYQNTFVNSVACFSRNERSAVGDHFGWHPATGPDVDKREGHVFINNLMSGDAGFDKPLLLVWQPPMLCEKLNRPHFKQIDHNVYVQTSDNRNTHLILWSPVKNDSCIIGFNSPVEIHELYPEFAGHSSLYKDYSVFKSPDLGNYQLIPEFPGTKTAAILPDEIRLLLNLPKQDIPYVGAYPLVR
ncbi:MAG: right-handed parallel beta-helix repeat-containing protein [Bacteroidales bacterium]|nr:right-handed parallel beta-helix repeat-containing protein [Bacteroidales bacterium]